MSDPRYATHPPSDIPTMELGPGVVVRLLAGNLSDHAEHPAAQPGPFRTVANVLMADFELAAGAVLSHQVPRGLNTALLYVYGGGGSVNGEAAPTHSVVQFDAADDAARGMTVIAGKEGLLAMLFAGTRLNEPIAWHDPIVVNTQAQLQDCFRRAPVRSLPTQTRPVGLQTRSREATSEVAHTVLVYSGTTQGLLRDYSGTRGVHRWLAWQRCRAERARLWVGRYRILAVCAIEGRLMAPWDIIPDVHDFLSARPVRSGVRSTGRARAVKPSVRT